MYKAPDAPDAVVFPVLNTIMPLTPVLPAFAVERRRSPLGPAVPYPDTIDKRPPAAAEADELPADRTSSPPVFVSPDPTVTYTDPDRPADAAPEPIYNAPEFPLAEVPELKITRPLIP